jgi:hypothetical protein
MLKDLPTGRKVKIIGGVYVGGIGVIVGSTEFFLLCEFVEKHW